MTATKVAIAAVLPALIVSGRFVVPALLDPEGGGLTWFFAVAGFLATLLGCLVAALLLRRQVALVPSPWVGAIGVTVAGILLAIFPTMPNWPFTSEGFLVAWVLIAAGLTAVVLFSVGRRYA